MPPLPDSFKASECSEPEIVEPIISSLSMGASALSANYGSNGSQVDESFLHTAWQRLCQQLQIQSEDYSAHHYQQLLAHYSQPQRAYHTLAHLTECLIQLEAVRHLAQQPALLELALWFHDAVYDPTQDGHDPQYNNEQQSANWAVQFLQQGQATASVQPGLDQDLDIANTAMQMTRPSTNQSIGQANQYMVQTNQTAPKIVEQLIMSTKHHQASSADEQLMVDIDLAILASQPSRFAQYEQQIRFEYQFVAQDIFVVKRREILMQFYQRERIYQSDYFYQHLEQTARQNLRQALGL